MGVFCDADGFHPCIADDYATLARVLACRFAMRFWITTVYAHNVAVFVASSAACIINVCFLLWMRLRVF